MALFGEKNKEEKTTSCCGGDCDAVSMDNVSIPIAILIWLIIYPMMMKIDFQSIKDVGKNPKGLFVTWVTNWLIKPFTMFGIAWLFFFVIFKTIIPAELAKDYLAGAILLGAAPCTAMVFVWSHLTKGNAAYKGTGNPRSGRVQLRRLGLSSTAGMALSCP